MPIDISEKGMWIRIKDGHSWLENTSTGIVAYVTRYRTTWYNQKGQVWDEFPDRDRIDGIYFLEFPDFIECSEEEAKALLKKG